ncbi:Peptidase family M28 [Chitinophaga jiangningensis]|uniref:Peptidase family M28 n=1 Tax=Chitinophaga jiangningensis TaxID=1419482 RepID=A0A1M7ELS6_9BACT|nr:M28 family peptidase [Chitinophaga jiangningensis]SHL92785.1 Peptidase family M28 [Chitinophaga jiangningensis]
MKWLFFCASILFAVPAVAQTDSVQLMKDISTLADDKYEGRKTGTAGNRQAQFYLLKRFQEAGLQPYHNTYEYPFYFKRGETNIMGTNLYGYIRGSDSKVIVISAHYDHVGIGKPNQQQDSIYNGADDNASGIGGLLAIASYFKQHPPKHTLIFLAADAEEMGLQGAKAFVARPPVPLQDIVLNINMDMIAHNDKDELYACGPTVNPQLKPAVEKVAARSNIKLLIGHDTPDTGADNWINQSDQGAFNQVKIPFIYFGVEDHVDYHKPSDEFKTINNSFYFRAVNTILDVIRELD